MISNSFDVIIATYNRPSSLMKLVDTILNCSLTPKHIIIVDSSPIENLEIQKSKKVMYYHASHGNQPYQRYFGYLVSKSEILFYFDDDMEIMDKRFFHKSLQIFEEKKVSGITFNNQNNHTFFETSPKPIAQHTISKIVLLSKWIKNFTGNPKVATGKYWLCGIKGKQPDNSGYTEWFFGGCFAVQKKYLYKNFNYKLLTIYEKKYGKGEDGIIGYTVSKTGKCWYCNELMLLHNDQEDSVYTKNYTVYGKRVAYSRLYLSSEYARLNHVSKSIVWVHYNWFMFWRVISIFINYVVDRDSKRLQYLKGFIYGWFNAVKETKQLFTFESSQFWKHEVNSDTK